MHGTHDDTASAERTDETPHEGTALLSKSQHHRYTEGLELEDEDLDANESDLLLARTASHSEASGLAPQSLESSMLRGRRYSKGSGRCPSTTRGSEDLEAVAESSSSSRTDVEAALAGQYSPREYLIDTNRRQFWLIFASIMSTFFIACFDGTIMASSHPVITSYFHSSNSASWLSTAFLLTSTSVQPMVGRFSDTIGRKSPYLVTMGIFAAATAWCALAQSMTSFIIARAVCGLGAGGMMSLGSIIISDLVDISRRGTYQSYANVVYGLASASGAAFGGLMADTLGWRWEFGVQVFPLLISLVICVFTIPKDLGLYVDRESFFQAMKAFDFSGSGCLTMSTTFLILGLNLGGNVLPWSHPFIIASLVVSAIFFPMFLYAESLAKRPIMPLHLLWHSPRANIIMSNFIASFLLNAILFNIPLFFQAVLLTTATESGLLLVVPSTVSSVIGTLTGLLITWTRRLKWPLWLGSLLYLFGIIVLAGMRRGWPIWAYLLCLVPSSMGQGFQFPGTFIAVLAVSEQEEQAVVTSTLALWRALGSVLGIACSSLVVQNALLVYLDAYVQLDPADGRNGEWKKGIIEKVRSSVEVVAGLESNVREQVVLSYEAAIRLTFWCCVGFAVVSVLLIAPVKLPRLGARK
ncbi:major facilitator superfamily domain-containing protein [Pseudomassariella vexata]|uniref:Major facilitator superfamily domain-containing protein n=1 Tax=Pseudomassariella vexata TaxID=1141098 RepID=A0A1Y2E1K6_9PEZI|nr:major facilitator superfamily domain-containing protein [Pseudomassariella vexata]ORY65206.1 major facilitator superfamily domain-containing protein [Pseudomassariella vexata]